MSCGWIAGGGGGRKAPGYTTQKATMERQDGHEWVDFLLVFVAFWFVFDDPFSCH